MLFIIIFIIRKIKQNSTQFIHIVIMMYVRSSMSTNLVSRNKASPI